LKDERALPSLRRGLAVDLEWDEFHNLNVKCLHAIANLEGTSAMEIVRDALSSPFEEVRLAAADILGAAL
jgi:hypothetical protein